jgi:hypothetical protein
MSQFRLFEGLSNLPDQILVINAQNLRYFIHHQLNLFFRMIKLFKVYKELEVE